MLGHCIIWFSNVTTLFYPSLIIFSISRLLNFSFALLYRNTSCGNDTHNKPYSHRCVASRPPLTHGGRDGVGAILPTFQMYFLSIKISLKFVPMAPFNNTPALIQIMAWCRLGDKPLSEPTMVCLMTHICVTRPQLVNADAAGDRYTHECLILICVNAHNQQILSMVQYLAETDGLSTSRKILYIPSNMRMALLYHFTNSVGYIGFTFPLACPAVNGIFGAELHFAMQFQFHILYAHFPWHCLRIYFKSNFILFSDRLHTNTYLGVVGVSWETTNIEYLAFLGYYRQLLWMLQSFSKHCADRLFRFRIYQACKIATRVFKHNCLNGFE